MANTALNRTTVALLTNKSGGSLAYGAVVVLDNTNAKGFTTTTTSGLTTRGLGVIIEPNGIANDATGIVAISGWCPKVTLNTAATVGQFIKSHTVAGQGTPHDAPQTEGDFGVALQASATPEMILFGTPNPPTSGIPVLGSSTDEGLVRWDGATGTAVQNTSAVTVSDTGVFTFPDNIRQTFNPGADAAGINVGSIAGDPGTPSNGDLWYDSTANELTARINGITRPIQNGANYTFAFGSGVTSLDPADATTYIFGDRPSLNPTASAETLRVTMPKAGTAKICYGIFPVVGTLASAGNSTLTLHNRTAVTSETISSAVALTANPTRFNNTAMTLAFSAGDELDISWLTPSWATNPTSVFGIIHLYVEFS